MTPRQYEEGVAAHFRSKGYQATLTPHSNDFGVDVFATKDRDRLAIQAKMYGRSSRPVNREMVLQLQGAKDYFECTGAIIVTDGRLTSSAREVAAKLGILVLTLDSDELAGVARVGSVESRPSVFDNIWLRHIIPLAGKTIIRANGESNTILRVDWTGVQRLTSNKNKNMLPIEVFRRTVDHLLQHNSITREYINDEYAKRGSSGVVLILSQVPGFERTTDPEGLRLAMPQ